jgi:hypothetical protein
VCTGVVFVNSNKAVLSGEVSHNLALSPHISLTICERLQTSI